MLPNTTMPTSMASPPNVVTNSACVAALRLVEGACGWGCRRLSLGRGEQQNKLGMDKIQGQLGSAAKLPYPDKHFDLVISITTLHNLYNYDLHAALGEIERVGRGAKYICVEAYRNEREKVNLMYWQLTCRAFHTPEEWDFVFNQSGYTGDHEFIFFE